MKIGIDVVEVSRIRSAVEKNSKFLKRVFTENEIKYFSGTVMKWESVAGGFAAKEAYSKYVGTGIGELSLCDIEVCHDEKGAPYLMIKGKKSKASLSITHSGNIAVATVCGKGERSLKQSKELSSLLPKRAKTAHKGQCGKVFILAGSKGMTGAACLCTMGALRAGAGLVTVGTSDSEQGVLACKLTEAMTVGYSSTSGCVGLFDKEKIKEKAEKSDVFIVGPGMGRETETKELLLWLIKNVETTMVVDADGLNALSENIDVLWERKGQTVLTPHEGEMALLCGKSVEDINKDRENFALSLAKKFGVTVVLKGFKTVVCNEKETFVNPTGNPGMATGGSGDVLSGVIGSLIAQGLSSYNGAVLGVYLHGLSGDLAKEDKGEMGLIASDIAENLPYAIKELSGE